MYVIVIGNNGRANCTRTSGNPEFRQSSANFCIIRRNSTVRKTYKTGQNESAEKPVHAYISFPSHAHGVYTIAPHLNMLNTPFVMHKQSFGNK
jgi:hypothetical protein